ncbi:MAG: hypothetical protein RLZZ519_1948 [Bacteroidota bacterium]|jgi:plasmid stabilization system protein ParE
MAEKIGWSEVALDSWERILDEKYQLASTASADKYASKVINLLEKLAENPSIGMCVDPYRGIRRWKIDKLHYILYLESIHGIHVVDILPYAANRKGFHRGH